MHGKVDKAVKILQVVASGAKLADKDALKKMVPQLQSLEKEMNALKTHGKKFGITTQNAKKRKTFTG